MGLYVTMPFHHQPHQICGAPSFLPIAKYSKSTPAGVDLRPKSDGKESNRQS
jgi:hypothetical protein